MPTSPTGGWEEARPGGFSLFELLLVLFMLAFFSTLLSVRLGGGSGDDLKLAGRVVTAEIRHARGKAAHTRTDHLLVFDFDRNAIHTKPDAERFTEDLGLITEEVPFDLQVKWTHLPRRIDLVGLVVAEKGKFRDGQAGIRFSASGSAERSLIHLKDDNDEFITLEIKPLTVQVRVHAGYLDQDT